MDEILDLCSGSTPEDKTMSRIHVARLKRRVTESEQDWVDVHAGKVLVEHLGFLLGISGCSMESILLLNLTLRCLLLSRSF